MGRPTSKKNYYDILNVRRDCSGKDIKAAYVKLSKKFHPDVKSKMTNSQQTECFQKIAEAYQTLSKPNLRAEYDRSLRIAQTLQASGTTCSRSQEIHRPWNVKPDYSPNPGPYYGIKGLNKTTNPKVALVLVVLGFVSGVLGFFSLKRSIALNTKHIDHISAKASEHHQKIRLDAENYSKDEQLQRIVDRMRRHAGR